MVTSASESDRLLVVVTDIGTDDDMDPQSVERGNTLPEQDEFPNQRPSRVAPSQVPHPDPLNQRLALETSGMPTTTAPVSVRAASPPLPPLPPPPRSIGRPVDSINPAPRLVAPRHYLDGWTAQRQVGKPIFIAVVGSCVLAVLAVAFLSGSFATLKVRFGPDEGSAAFSGSRTLASDPVLLQFAATYVSLTNNWSADQFDRIIPAIEPFLHPSQILATTDRLTILGQEVKSYNKGMFTRIVASEVSERSGSKAILAVYVDRAVTTTDTVRNVRQFSRFSDAVLRITVVQEAVSTTNPYGLLITDSDEFTTTEWTTAGNKAFW
jgi:hypothetical protein